MVSSQQHSVGPIIQNSVSPPFFSSLTSRVLFQWLCFILQGDSKMFVRVSVAYNFQNRNNFRNMKVNSFTFLSCTHHSDAGENILCHTWKERLLERKQCGYIFFSETKSVIRLQCRYRTQYGKDPLSGNVIKLWSKQFQEKFCTEKEREDRAFRRKMLNKSGKRLYKPAEIN